MANGPGQNATVEEILASIRQAISEDDARRVLERNRTDSRPAEKRPVARVTDVFEAKVNDTTSPDASAAPSDEPHQTIEHIADAGAAAEHELIEQAIEQALDGVRSEIEGVRPIVAAARARVGEGSASIPRAARVTPTRRDAPSPARVLLSGRSDAQVSQSFERLAKAMVDGDPHTLDAAVEEVLRPMLKQWLDANLPQMVERLVREEIERVARGRR